MGKYRPSSHGEMGLRMGCEADGQHHLNWNARFGKEQRGRGPGQDPGLRLSGRGFAPSAAAGGTAARAVG